MEEAVNNSCSSNGSSIDGLGNNEDVCRDFLRNVCTRGSRCKFRHSVEETRSANPPRFGGLIFCHDFQNTHCNRPMCKFVHGSRQDEEHYKVTGEIPKHINSSPPVKGNMQENINEPEIPLCKDHLKGECQRGKKCKFRHIEQTRTELRNRQDRAEDYEMPEAKRRNFGTLEFCSHNHSSHQYEYGALFRDSSPPIQCHYGQVANSNTTLHLPVLNGCKQLEICVLHEENILLRRKVDDLKKQVSDLMATNEFLLDQNAHLRLQGKLPTVSTVATVTLPTVTIASSVTVPVTTSVTALGPLGPIPTVQTVQAMATLPLVTPQSTSTLNASIPYASSVSLAQSTPMATVSIAPVTINQTAAMAAQAPTLSAATATVTLTPTLSATALQLGPNTALSLSGGNGGSLVSYPIMTQSIMAPATLQTSLTH